MTIKQIGYKEGSYTLFGVFVGKPGYFVKKTKGIDKKEEEWIKKEDKRIARLKERCTFAMMNEKGGFYTTPSHPSIIRISNQLNRFLHIHINEAAKSDCLYINVRVH